MPDRPVTAILLAAGQGTRMGTSTPKVLLEIAGKPVLEWSVAAFESTAAVDHIIVVAHPDLVSHVQQLVGQSPKVVSVVPGGNTRSASTLNGLRAVSHDDGTVLVHDAARPLITPAAIAELVAELDDAEAATLAVPASDTVLRVEESVIVDIPDRSGLWHAQTPQGFSLTTLRAAFAAAEGTELDFTDDCGLVRRFLPDVPIRVVEGSVENLKITRDSDIPLAEELIASRLEIP